MFLTIQAIGTAYVISAVTKLQVSGFGWVLNAQNIAVEIVKSGCQKTIDTQFVEIENYARFIASAILNYPYTTKLIFCIALLIELFAFTAGFSKNIARKYGWLLMLLHAGMFFVIGILIIPFAALVFIYLVNPVGAVLCFGKPKLATQNFITASFESAKHTVKTRYARELLYLLCLPIIFLSLTKYIGDVHPFSNFPMYSYFPTHTEFYYLANENNEPLSTHKNFGMRTSDLKQMVLVRIKSSTIKTNSANELNAIAEDVLINLSKKNTSNLIKSNTQKLKLIKHSIAIKNNIIQEHEVTLATIKIN